MILIPPPLGQTGVWTELAQLEERFTQPLRVGLNMSRAHYEMELQRTMDGPKGKVKGEGQDPRYGRVEYQPGPLTPPLTST